MFRLDDNVLVLSPTDVKAGIRPALSAIPLMGRSAVRAADAGGTRAGAGRRVVLRAGSALKNCAPAATGGRKERMGRATGWLPQIELGV